MSVEVVQFPGGVPLHDKAPVEGQCLVAAFLGSKAAMPLPVGRHELPALCGDGVTLAQSVFVRPDGVGVYVSKAAVSPGYSSLPEEERTHKLHITAETTPVIISGSQGGQERIYCIFYHKR